MLPSTTEIRLPIGSEPSSSDRRPTWIHPRLLQTMHERPRAEPNPVMSHSTQSATFRAANHDQTSCLSRRNLDMLLPTRSAWQESSALRRLSGDPIPIGAKLVDVLRGRNRF